MKAAKVYTVGELMRKEEKKLMEAELKKISAERAAKKGKKKKGCAGK